ncbi:MAG TPA: mycothiol synthase [Acidimicrobiales bacterium]|nr:mycothiol synthase [Acidimicrobiales bacterium]
MRIEVKRQMGSGDIAAVSGLLDNAARHDDHPALGDHQWVDLVHGGRQGFAGLVAWETGHDHPTGYAQVTRGADTWALEHVVDPHHRDDGRRVARALLGAALKVVAEQGGGHIHMWVPRATEADDDMARSLGLGRGRELLQMRRPLPLPPEEKAVATRAFVPGRDEESWLEVNNRAFAWHPEQGGWDVQTLRDREAEPWFDPAGFLLHERDGRLAGFCWTKIHADRRPHLGEIYVIAVDPDFQGLHLGRALVVSGLRYLEGRGLDVGMLYVDGGNTPAVGLYKDMGFTVDHTDQAYVGDVAPAS